MDIEIQAKEIMFHKANLNRIMAECTGQPIEQARLLGVLGRQECEIEFVACFAQYIMLAASTATRGVVEAAMTPSVYPGSNMQLTLLP